MVQQPKTALLMITLWLIGMEKPETLKKEGCHCSGCTIKDMAAKTILTFIGVYKSKKVSFFCAWCWKILPFK